MDKPIVGGQAVIEGGNVTLHPASALHRCDKGKQVAAF